MKDKMTTLETIKMMKYSTLSLLKQKRNKMQQGSLQPRIVFTVYNQSSTASELTHINGVSTTCCVVDVDVDVFCVSIYSLNSTANKLYVWIWFIKGKSLYSPKWCFITKFHWIFADYFRWISCTYIRWVEFDFMSFQLKYLNVSLNFIANNFSSFSRCWNAVLQLNNKYMYKKMKKFKKFPVKKKNSELHEIWLKIVLCVIVNSLIYYVKLNHQTHQHSCKFIILIGWDELEYWKIIRYVTYNFHTISSI